MKSGLIKSAALALGLMAVSGARAAPVTQDNFTLASAGDLVALCQATASDPLYTAAQNFCHGFAVGTYRVLAVEETASRGRLKIFCPPAATMARTQAIAGFVTWASARPQILAGSPSDAIAGYLAVQYPCK